MPVLVLKRGRPQACSRQRYGMACLQPTCTFTEPHLGQQMPLGQRWRMNHCSAVSSFGYSLMNCLSEMPLRNALPGCSLLHTYILQEITQAVKRESALNARKSTKYALIQLENRASREVLWVISYIIPNEKDGEFPEQFNKKTSGPSFCQIRSAKILVREHHSAGMADRTMNVYDAIEASS